MKKNPFLSKTLWANFIVAGLAFFPGVAEKFSADQVMMFMGVLNMILRMVTKEQIGLE